MESQIYEKMELAVKKARFLVGVFEKWSVGEME
jgi:hypothetical protein